MDLFSTEGIRYTGSKRVILPKIYDKIKDLPIKTVLDGFTGSTRTGQMFKRAGYHVDTNDVAVYSKVLSDAYIVNNGEIDISDELCYLNTLSGYDGWFTENYSGQGQLGEMKTTDGKKKPYHQTNARKIDAIRDEIDHMEPIYNLKKSLLLTSLINAMDRVENTLGHQVAYLNAWSKRSLVPMKLVKPMEIIGDKKYHSLSVDIKTIKQPYDLIYLDPPYNTNNTHTPTTRIRYASYYHLWSTVVKNDKPVLIGASNRREEFGSDRNPNAVSAYESTSYQTVYDEINSLIANTNAKWILFSYSNKGKIKKDDLHSLFGAYGKVSLSEFTHKENVQKSLTTTKQYLGDSGENLEYLFLLERA